MDVFLSYSAKQRDIAERLGLSLEGQGYEVFFDRSSIQEGGEYDATIRRAIESCSLFVFLISRDSVAPGSYALAEVAVTERRWKHPSGHVLPVRVDSIPVAEIPPYLRAVSILEPRGDLVAEASAAVARVLPRKSRVLWPAAAAIVVALVLLASWFAYSRTQQNRARSQEVQKVVAAAELDRRDGRYDAAFRSLGDALTRFPGEPVIQRERERLAMTWLRDIRVRVSQQTFTDVVNMLRPVIADGAAAAHGAEAGDLLAHLGWGEYLRARDGASTDPAAYFQRAVEADGSNPFAHAMWGFWILYRRGPLAEAAQHFEKAAGTGRERAWVRNLELSALTLYHNPEFEVEAIRVANTMRKDQVTVNEPARLWSIYDWNLMSMPENPAFFGALPGEEHVTTFRWLFPENKVEESRAAAYRLFLGRLQEAAGHRDEALAAYRSIESDMQRRNSTGRLLDRSREGIRRLSARK